MTVEKVKEVLFSDEAAFGELVDTYTDHPPVLAVRPTFPSARADDRSLQSRLAEQRPGYLMPRSGGAIEIDVYACGALIDTKTGALTATWLQHLLADGLGGGDITEVGGTVSGGATATSLPYTAATLVRGGAVRLGQKGDGRADGQLVVVGTPTATPATLLTAAQGVPNAADLIRACMIAYPKETLGLTKRFLVGYTGSGQQYVARGCQLSGIKLDAKIGQVPVMTLSYRVAFWNRVTFAIPSGVALADCKAQIMTGGSFFLQTVATATRALESASEIGITISLGLLDKPVNIPTAQQLQTIGGYERSQCDVGLTLTIPWTNAKEAEYDLDGSASTQKHFLCCCGVGDGSTAGEGRSFGFYLPQIFYSGSRPTYRDYNGLLYQDISFMAREGPDTSSELARSNIRFFQS